MKKSIWLISIVLVGLGGDAVAGKLDWIATEPDEQFRTVARHLRGLDMAMVEIGYRYQELAAGIAQQNWPYVEYQHNKIGLSLRHALERRPKRAASAQQLFFPELARFGEVVAGRDDKAIASAFKALTASCNTCHQAEGVASFVVIPSGHRPAPIGAP